ncbi:MAG: hypothetical protein FJZ57_00680 [Chlamydiae bacterium]|nr:hypothetical protein [Chlamydiota bacterium]
MSSNINQNSLNNSDAVVSTFYVSDAAKKRKKDEEKQAEMLASLIVMLEDVINVVASSESGDPSVGIDKLKNDSKKLSDLINGKDDLSKQSYTPSMQCISSDGTSSPNIAIHTGPVPSPDPTPAPTPAPSPIDTSTTSTSSNASIIPSSYPSTQEMADAMATMSIMIKGLEAEMLLSSNEQYKMACEMMIAQMDLAYQVLYDYNNTANYVNEEWAKYNQYINDHMKQYQDWMNHTKTETSTVKNDGTGGRPVTTSIQVPDPQIDKVENDIEQYCLNEFGLTIYLDPHCTDLNAIINSANQQVYAYLMSLMDVAEANVETAFLYSTNPVLQEIGKMIFNDAEFDKDALRMLANILNETLEKMTITTSMPSDYSSGPSNQLVTKILSIMTETISDLETMIAKYEAKQTEDSTDISKKYGNSAKTSLEKAKDQLNYIEKLIHDTEQDNELCKIMGYIVEGLMIAVGVATCNYELVIIASTMMALQETGVMDQLKDELTTAFTNMLIASGESESQAKKDAAILADVVIILVVAAACYGVGGGVGLLKSAAETAGEAAAESTSEIAVESLSESLAESVAESTETSSTELAETSEEAAVNKLAKINMTLEAVSELTSGQSITENEVSTAINVSNNTTTTTTEQAVTDATQKVTDMVNYTLKYLYDMMPELSSAAKLSTVMGIQEVVNTHLATDSTKAYLSANTDMSEKEIAKQAMIAEIIVDVTLTIASIGLFSSTASNAEAKVTKEAETNSEIVKMYRKIKEAVTNNSQNLFRLASGITFGATMVETGANIDKSINLAKQSIAERELGKDQAYLTFFLNLQEMSNDTIKENMQEYTQTLNTREKIDSTMLANMLSYQAEYTKILSQSA